MGNRHSSWAPAKNDQFSSKGEVTQFPCDTGIDLEKEVASVYDSAQGISSLGFDEAQVDNHSSGSSDFARDALHNPAATKFCCQRRLKQTVALMALVFQSSIWR